MKNPAEQLRRLEHALKLLEEAGQEIQSLDLPGNADLQALAALTRVRSLLLLPKIGLTLEAGTPELPGLLHLAPQAS